MASNHHTDEVFTQKRKPKTPIKFNLVLNEEQKQAKAIILENPVTVLKGMAGSGKTLVAVQAALDLLFRRSRRLNDFENENKNLEKARTKNKEVQQAENAQQEAKKKFEQISEVAKTGNAFKRGDKND